MSFVRGISTVSIVLVLGLVLGTAGHAHAQQVPGVTRPATVASVAASAAPRPAEEEAADSPRASMRTFLDLCDRGRYEEAAHYLDVPKGAETRTAELAHKLNEVLDQRLWIDAEHLSPSAHGKKEDALPPGTEELGKIADSKGHLVSIRIVRHEAKSPEDEPRWVFSQATVHAIDPLHASLKARWVREHLPAVLLLEGPATLSYWQWIAIPLLAAACVAVGRLFTSVTGAIARRFTAKKTWGAHLVERLRWPVTTAWALALFWAALPYLALTIHGEELVERLLRALGYLAFFWALLRSVNVAGEELADAKWASSRPNVRSVTSVGVRLGKVIVAALALMVALSQLGYPVTTVIAGLGIGGVVLALAAQKTVENLFGSISILADQPFGVGDTIRVDGVEGTVETIGLRSTRMRTVERTLIIMPNGKLADMRIESLGPRDRIRFSAKLSLSRETKLAQIGAVVAGVHAQVIAHASVYKDDVLVRFSALGESSFDIDISAPIETTSSTEFAKIREELLFACVRVVDDAGVRLAVPARRVIAPRPE